MVQFELRGNTGEEKIKITNLDGSVKGIFDLTKKWKTFEYHVPEKQPIIIDFLDGKDALGVYLKDAHKFEVSGSKYWVAWRCGHSDEKDVCQKLRDGKWGYEGKYKIKPNDNKGMLIKADNLVYVFDNFTHRLCIIDSSSSSCIFFIIIM